MKKLNPINCLLLISLCFSCNNAPVKVLGTKDYNAIMFENDNYDKVLAASKAQNKPIFMDVYTEWCGWCKKLDNETYRDPNVISYINKNFIPLKIDAEFHQGPAIKAKYGINSYPRIIFLDSTGKALETIMGYRNPFGLLQAANKAIKKYNKN
jgi:thiol:disulfide interchange protein